MHIAGFSPLNFTVLGLYLGAMLLVGLLLARRQRSTEDFFLAGRRMPWLIVAMSMYASLTSAVTYVGLPATAFKENTALIVVAVVSPLLAPFLILVFYPFYQRLRVTTSYEYLGRRFGPRARWAASGLFVLARLGWLGTVIYAPAMALHVVTGVPLWAAVLMMGAVATGYTALGGVSADIWSDVIQFVIMIGGAAWVAATLVARVPGGFQGILDLAARTGHLRAFDWHFSLTEMTGAVVALTFFFQLMQDYGTDQTTVQRLMATPTLRGMGKAIAFNAVTDFAIVALLLFIGLGLFAYSRAYPHLLPPDLAGDRVLPYYVIHALPDGVSGLLVTAILAAAMSSMDSGISSLSTVVIHDFLRPLRGAPAAERHDLLLARVLTFAFGAVATAVAFYVARFQHIIAAYTTIISLFNAPVLALFLLGMLTRRGRFAGWVAGAAVAIPTTAALQGLTPLHWVYYFPVSFGLTFGVGYLVSRLMPALDAPRGLTVWDRAREPTP